MKVWELITALDYIEDNICGELRISDIARHCCVSLSALQKTFKYVFHFSINDYILRRRFSCAARELLTTDSSVLDISLKYGYSNAESFTRGFQRLWGVSPSRFRKNRKFSGHTPKLTLPEEDDNREDYLMSGVSYDLTELYDVIQDRRNNAYVCADLKGLMWINDNLGTAAGDAALLELMRRIEEACSNDDVFLRIGGDEFVVFTASADMAHAEEIVSTVTAKNQQPVKYMEQEIPVSIHIGAFKNEFSKEAPVNVMFDSIASRMKEIHAR